MRARATVVAVIAVVTLLTGAAPAAAQPPAPVPIPETAAGTPVTVFVNDPAIVNAYPTRPQAWSRLPGDRAVRLHFTIGDRGAHRRRSVDRHIAGCRRPGMHHDRVVGRPGCAAALPARRPAGPQRDLTMLDKHG
ncbi:hypothetical protein PDG61_24515 [Mycolicibacterium sp. BiH015]|uniref:hypothetical protein n=1 Tax=Mycolicibacterium sp. BiH015 TaxID=3018808 RepID=UPI0022E74937|nr:hypothetical protein [Mycolicibacterium sp. BiH015]MDA2894094.1 hypothetical protein [Mycolicibacterium sp. BiH015]